MHHPTSAATSCELADAGDLQGLSRLPPSTVAAPDKNGNLAIHWAAGSGRLEVLRWLIASAGLDPDSEGRASTRSKRRRPLHFAARNGQLEVVRHLCEVAGVEADARDSQSVSPFQLAVWQNRLDVARYLVEQRGVDATQLNVFACGAQHWLGTCPRERSGAEGEALLPMAQWLGACGVDWQATQRQGHRPLHKASWGGHLALCRWLRDECGALDDLADLSGNYAADVAEMGGHATLAQWLRAECSDARARSCAALGLPADTTDPAVIRAAFFACARRLHPDRQPLRDEDDDAEALVGAVGGGAEVAADFEAARAAYEHLTRDGGVGRQANPTHSLRAMLQATSTGGGASGGGVPPEREAARYFKARLLAVVHEYGSEGIPIGSLRRKFAQVWRHEGAEVPPPAELGLPPKLSLQKMLEHFTDAVSVVTFPDGRPARIRAVVSREEALGLGGDSSGSGGGRGSAHRDVPTGAASADEPPASLEPTNAPASAVPVPVTQPRPPSAAAAPPPPQPLPQPPPRPQLTLDAASATTVSLSLSFPPNDDASTAPVVIVGGGIGGLAAAVALQSRGVRCVVYERDSYDTQRRGYGLTLGPTCWAALADLGLEGKCRAIDGVCGSSCHWVFDDGGGVLGYFGTAFSGQAGKGRNLRVPRATLRSLLLAQLAPGTVRWGRRLLRYQEDDAAGGRRGVTVHFQQEAEAEAEAGNEDAAAAAAVEAVRARLLIGADGVRSAVRQQKVADPLRYVGVVLLLGVSPLRDPLLHRQGFYTVDGTCRLFTMPYEPLDSGGSGGSGDDGEVEEGGGGEAAHSTMWQISIAIGDAAEAAALCAAGSAALLAEVQRRCGGWHAPVPAMLAATPETSVWGTPLFDRAPLPVRKRQQADAGGAPFWSRVTLLGDAAHAMTPFKGQGANQALADSILVGRHIAPALLAEAADLRQAGGHAGPGGGGGSPDAREARVPIALAVYEREMGARAQAKVTASRDAAGLYHSAAALDPAAYGVAGVAADAQPALLAALRGAGVGAGCGAELEARAVATAAALREGGGASADNVGGKLSTSESSQMLFHGQLCERTIRRECS